MTIDERWMPIPGFDGEYEVSDLGRIRTLKARPCRRRDDRMLTLHKHPRGYMYVHLSSDNRSKKYRVHRLVMLAFVGACPDEAQVNHRNGDKADNRLCNLEYCTGSQNQRHRFDVLNQQGTVGEINGQAKLTEQDILRMRELYHAGLAKQKELAAMYSISQGAVSMIVNGKRWGYINVAQ